MVAAASSSSTFGFLTYIQSSSHQQLFKLQATPWAGGSRSTVGLEKLGHTAIQHTWAGTSISASSSAQRGHLMLFC